MVSATLLCSGPMTRGIRLTLFTLAALTLGACGKGDGGGPASEPPKMETPKASAQSVTAAFKARSGPQALAIMPTAELLKKSFDCPGDELGKQLAGARDRVPKEFVQVPADMDVALGQFDKQGTEETVYKPGETFEGCKVKEAVTVHKSRLELQISKGGKTEYQNKTWRFFKFGTEEKWYFLD